MNLAQFAAFVGPPIATLLAIFALVVVRGTKITEFRQAWINSQRDDLAIILAQVSTLAASALPATPAALSQFDLAEARIRLREKPADQGFRRWRRLLTFRSTQPEWAEALAVIGTMRNALTASPPTLPGSPDLMALRQELVALAQVRLKAEWSRVRGGERGYKLLLLLAALLAFGPTIPLVSSMTDHWLKTGHMPTTEQMMTGSGYKSE